jgi:hypothetical protein
VAAALVAPVAVVEAVALVATVAVAVAVAAAAPVAVAVAVAAAVASVIAAYKATSEAEARNANSTLRTFELYWKEYIGPFTHIWGGGSIRNTVPECLMVVQ